MVGEGHHHKREDRTCGGDEADEVSVHRAELDVKVQQFCTFKVWRMVALKVIGVENLRLVVVFCPLEEPSVITVTGETIALKIHVNETW